MNRVCILALCAAHLWLARAALAGSFVVATNVPSGTNSVTIAWTNVLAAATEKIVAAVESPAQSGAGAYRMFANVVRESITTNSAQVTISGRTDTTGYVVRATVWE